MNLYHYCSNHTFHSIITNRSIWLSSLLLSNDTMEGRLVYDLIDDLARKDGLEIRDMEQLQQKASRILSLFDGLGFCLSEDGDLLSQWRGYASDATGISIGFNKEYLELLIEEYRKKADILGFSLKKVVYDYNEQLQLVKPTYLKIKELINQGVFRAYHSWGFLLGTKSETELDQEKKELKALNVKLTTILTSLIGELFLLKTNAFCEEKEWRLVSFFLPTLKDSCSFRACIDRIVPYREYVLIPIEIKKDIDIINEVLIGPKNLTPPQVIKSLLEQNNFNDVTVKNSIASYR